MLYFEEYISPDELERIFKSLREWGRKDRGHPLILFGDVSGPAVFSDKQEQLTRSNHAADPESAE